MNRIAIIGSRGYPSHYSGFETLVRHLAPYLVEQGEYVTVYNRDRGILSKSDWIDGIEVRSTMGLDHKSTSTLTFGLSSSLDAVRRDFDSALVLNVANGFHLGRLRRGGIRTCVNVDGMEWLREKWGYVAKEMFIRGAKLTAKYADELVFDSIALAEGWEDKFGRSGTFIPYGAPVLDDVPDDRLMEHGLTAGEYVLAVCRVVPENNLDLLFDAIEGMGIHIPVVVVGDSNYVHPTSIRLKELAMSGKVLSLGHVNDQELLDELWGNAGVYWHGHSVGGTNPSLLQALGAGAPTIALDTVFNREVIIHDDQLTSRDPKELATRILMTLESKEIQSRMGAWGKKVVNERYSWAQVCAAYHKLLIAKAI